MHRALIFASVLVMAGSAATAQVVQRPARSASDAAARTRHELTFEGSLLGGYDDNLVPPTGGDVFAPYPSGYTAFGDGSLSYRVGNQVKFLEATGEGFMNTYRNVGLGPSYGGGQQLRARTPLGRRNALEASQYVRYAPYFSLGLLGAIQPDSEGDNTTSTMNESGSWARGASLSFNRQWTRRMSTDFAYLFSDQTYVDEAGFDSRTQLGTLGLNRSLGRWTTVRARYQYSDGHYAQAQGGSVPILVQGPDVGFSYERRLSATRQLTLSGGGGASHVDTVTSLTLLPTDYWAPTSYGAVRLDFKRSWSLGGDYRYSTQVLQGDTPQPFMAHTGQISVGGDLHRKLESVFTAGYSNGVAGVPTIGTLLGRYDGYSGTAQLRFQMMAGWSSIASWTHYEYRLNPVASQSLGVSRQMQRNAVRVGLSWSMPLVGAN